MKTIIRFSWLHVRIYTLDCNHHGSGGYTLRNAHQIVRMGSYAKSWTLYIYGRTGRAYCLNVTFPRWRGPWPKDCAEREPRP